MERGLFFPMNIIFLILASAFAAAPLPPMPAQPPETLQVLAQARPDQEIAISINLKLPKRWRLHPEQKFLYRVSELVGAVKLDRTKRKGFVDKPSFPIKIPFTPPDGKSAVVAQIAFYYCPKKSLEDCKAFSRYYRFPIESAAEAKTKELPLLVEPD